MRSVFRNKKKVSLHNMLQFLVDLETNQKELFTKINKAMFKDVLSDKMTDNKILWTMLEEANIDYSDLSDRPVSSDSEEYKELVRKLKTVVEARKEQKNVKLDK